MNQEIHQLTIGNTPLTIEFNDWMQNTNASVVASMGDTVVMVAVSVGGESNKDYFPLKVEYQERHYARGEILGGQYNKREGKPSDEAVLTARIVDRAIRPYFPKDFTREVLVVVTVLSLGEYDPDVLGLIGTALALERSSIPWNGPVVGTRFMLRSDGVLITNPTFKDRMLPGSEGFVALHGDKVCMLEVEGAELSEDALMNVIGQISEILVPVRAKYAEIIAHNKQEKIRPKETQFQALSEVAEAILFAEVPEHFSDAFNDDFKKPLLKKFKDEALAIQPEVSDIDVFRVFDTAYRKVLRNEMSKGRRVDGRDIETLRPLFANIGVLPTQVHGSGLFYRGATHVLGALTVGYADDALMIDEMEIHEQKQFFLHYNFPPYSVGEVGNIGSPGRREIGHGMLAEKAFRKVLPSPQDFPYTIRVVCEVLSSNGSTSMASVCAASLAMFDAGIPLKRHVAGIAIGLIEEQGSQVLLTDILGKEDHYGDMDFKVAGTEQGITAIQLDCKNDGLTEDILRQALDRAKNARVQILETLKDRISMPKSLTSKVQQTEKVTIPVSKIGLVIGKAGVTIKEIIKLSGAKIDIRQDGTVLVIGSADAIKIAREKILGIVGVAPEVPKL